MCKFYNTGTWVSNSLHSIWTDRNECYKWNIISVSDNIQDYKHSIDCGVKISVSLAYKTFQKISKMDDVNE